MFKLTLILLLAVWAVLAIFPFVIVFLIKSITLFLAGVLTGWVLAKI